jgi:hypothetical protein
MEQVIYEDRPNTDIWMKLVIALPSAVLIISALMIISTNLQEAIYMFIASACILLVLNYIVIPAGYIIYDSKISIRFRGPLAFNMPFSTIKTLRRARALSFGINLPTSISAANALEIVRKKRMAVVITPGDKQAFLANFEKAFKEWQTYGGK